MTKRFFDIIFSLFCLIVLMPILIIIAIIIKFDSKGDIIYKQKRVGKLGKVFLLYKFRTMFDKSDTKGLLTVGDKDSRITKVGYLLRKYKLDELLQFINVLKGDMSIVGPRPEVEKYVSLYDFQQKKILNVKPGITDIASIVYRNESDILSKQVNPEEYYIKEILPSKIEMGLEYISKQSFVNDLKIIFQTIYTILK